MSETYKGLFIRDTLDDHGTIPSVTGAPTYSPDIICYQTDILSLRDAAISYNRYICKEFRQGDVNNVFVRLKNNADSLLEGKIKAYYAPLNLLYQPSQWTPLHTETGDEILPVISEGAEVGVLPGKIGMGERAFKLDSVKDPNKHHCMMGLVSNVDGSFIDLPSDFKNDYGLWAFLRNHPQIAYNNIKIVQPEKRVFETPVRYGNYDESPRKFILSIDVMEGLETLDGTEILVQSTNLRRPFSYTQTVSAGQSGYSCEYTVSGRFFDYLDFAFVMPNYSGVNALLHVQNFVLNDAQEQMAPDVSLVYDEGRGSRRAAEAPDGTGTMLGDFFICLGRNMDGVKAGTAVRRSTEALPVIRVNKQC